MKHDRLVHAQKTHDTAPNTIHPAIVLEELSDLRFQTSDPVWRDAVVAVDVGDVTLVRWGVALTHSLGECPLTWTD